MKIIILGAGQVGSSLAYHLSGEHNDITVVDARPEILRELQDRADLRTVLGQGSHPDVLAQAGAEDADMLIAVTNSDEVNMLACRIAYTLYRTPTKIARVRTPSYLEHTQLFGPEVLPVDVLISPEQLVTEHIQRLVTHPGVTQVLDFAGGRVQMVGVKAYYGGSLVGHEIRHLPQHMPGIEVRVAAIFRRGRSIAPDGHTVIEPDDDVYFVAEPKYIRAMTAELRRLDKPYKRILIAGGGNIGTRLALALEARFTVKLIEQDVARCKHLSQILGKTVVLRGDAADQELLLEESIDNMDVFVALTNDDEANILSAMLAKRLGARKVISLINRPSYAELVESGVVDIAISPQQITLGALLSRLRRGDVVTAHSLRRGAAEAIEAIVHGDAKTSRVVGRRIEDLRLPEGVRVAALVRGTEVIIAHHDSRIQAEDHLILFVADKRDIAAVERLFQVGLTFL